MKTMSEADAGKAAVEQAIQFLKTYYEGAGFLQRGSFVPTNSDRDGKTVGDLAPEVFDSEYQGAQESSKGIIGLLEVILADFDRTHTTVDGQETQAQTDFEAFETQNTGDTQEKEGFVETKEGQVADIEDDLTTLGNSLADEEKDHEDALKELEVLHSQCVAGEETYEERVANRKKEIEALKEAHDILENWQ